MHASGRAENHLLPTTAQRHDHSNDNDDDGDDGDGRVLRVGRGGQRRNGGGDPGENDGDVADGPPVRGQR